MMTDKIEKYNIKNILKMKRLHILTLVPLLMAAGCSEKKVQSDDMETGKVEFVCTVTSGVGAATRVGDTKSLPEKYVPGAEELKLVVSDGGEFTATYETMADYDQPFLDEGDYKAVFTYGDQEVEGIGKSCFAAENPFTIVARKTITNQVSATLVNSLYTVKLSDWFSKYYSDYNLTVHTASGNNYALVGSASAPAGESDLIFVKPGTEIFISGSATKTNGVEVHFQKVKIGNTTARTWHTITIDAEQVSKAGIVVSFDDTPTAIKEIPVELNPDA